MPPSKPDLAPSVAIEPVGEGVVLLAAQVLHFLCHDDRLLQNILAIKLPVATLQPGQVTECSKLELRLVPGCVILSRC